MDYENPFIFVMPHVSYFYFVIIWEKGGGKRGAYLLSAQTSRYNIFFHQFFMLESHSKLSERTPFRPPFFKRSRGKNMTRGVSLE